ncbi:PREDICTED: protein Skeletor, isoforms B/C [Ceratosolen solmsi marchali]|uniref:Protein Skeletor, isoforms B/C n=1 Tax=Ceratosolen solmsi marchali TaxID=326594 RepID=A0AAJ6YLQ2_9HYME|nr:PREDICTED: protein Skeletor, isoforms B/C [Ceratosolen solmsi marchali]
MKVNNRVQVEQCTAAYHGKLIDKLSELHHGVSGEVYAVDARTLFIKDFTYDGEGPAAFFYAGNSKTINNNGFKVRDEYGTTNLLKRYRKKDITLTLPEGKTLSNIKWFSVYCDDFAVNFGDVKIPRNFDYPRPQKLASLSGIHGVSSDPVVIVDAQTLLIPNFSYDGEAPDAKFWVGSGSLPSSQGIRVPDENGKEVPLRRYDHKTIVLTLPGDITIYQIGHFGVWCEAFAVDFGHVEISQQHLNVPPSLKMLGISPQSKLNCEVLDDDLAFEVRWAVAGDSIVVQLVGKLEANQYMSFGVSPDPKRSLMINGDVVVTWVDKQSLQGYAIDYFLDSKSQCSGGRGSCPDRKIQENTNSVRLLNAAMVNGYSIVTYQRPLRMSDELDQEILTNVSQAIIWAVGPLNDKNEVSFHSNYLKGDRFIEFGRPPAWNCPMPELQDQQQSDKQLEQQQPIANTHHLDQDNNGHNIFLYLFSGYQLAATTRRPMRIPATPPSVPKEDAWEIPPIQCFEPEDGVFYAQMGPTGGKHGYPAITGHVGWGISWYINGLLIPEIHVVRGKKYTFVVEGGENDATPARYHPFYITDDPVGGYQHMTSEERANVTIFAGVRRQRGVVRPTGLGRLCNWMPDQNQPPADEYASFGAYQRTLTLICDHGEPGIVSWTPDVNTPDTVYYQCFTHRYLGWKIHVHDTCDLQQESASNQHETFVVPHSNEHYQLMDLNTDASSRANPSKVTPSPEFFQQQREYVSQDYNNLRIKATYPQPHHYYHPQSTTNNPDQLIIGPYLSDHQLYHHYSHHNYNRKIPQLTLASLQKHNVKYVEDQRRSPTKHVHDDAINYIIHRNNNNHHQFHQPLHNQQVVMAYNTQESSDTSKHKSQNSKYNFNSQYSKIVADNDQILRRPSAALMNQIVDMPLQESYSIPMYESTTPSQKIIYTTAQFENMKIQTPRPSQMMIMHGKLKIPTSTYFHTMVKRPHSLISSIASYQNEENGGSDFAKSPIKTPVFHERKQIIHKTPLLSRTYNLGKYPHHQYQYYYQPTKLMKVDTRQSQSTSKITPSNILSEDKVNLLRSTIIKPIRTMGFDPKSIVIEKGFKPILTRNSNKKGNFDKNLELIHDKVVKESMISSYNNSFEPVFFPSPLDKNIVKPKKKKIQLIKTKLNKVNDMKMDVADKDHQDYASLYFPTFASSIIPTKANFNSSFHLYLNPNITFPLKYENQEPILKINSSSLQSSSKTFLNSRFILTVRKKRFTKNETRLSKRPDMIYQPNHAVHAQDNLEHRLNHNDSYNNNDHKQTTNNLYLASAGKIILANIQYVILTVILYYIL